MITNDELIEKAKERYKTLGGIGNPDARILRGLMERLENIKNIQAINESNLWKDMSTAPRTGEFYLAVNSDGEMRIENRPEGCRNGVWHKVGKEWCGSLHNFNPIMWRSLPELPMNFNKTT